MVYLTDTEFRLRKAIGNEDFQKSKEIAEFNFPSSIVVDATGNFIVSEYGGGRLQAFDRYGNFLSLIDTPMTNGVISMALDDNSRLFLVLAKSDQVKSSSSASDSKIFLR